jgi:lysozyme family protein
MSSAFNACFDILIGHEGVYTANPDDKGNWTGGQCGVGKCLGTKYGISARASFPAFDIKNLTLDAARGIYLESATGGRSAATNCLRDWRCWSSTLL